MPVVAATCPCCGLVLQDDATLKWPALGNRATIGYMCGEKVTMKFDRCGYRSAFALQ
jgi:hypothetical protein